MREKRENQIVKAEWPQNEPAEVLFDQTVHRLGVFNGMHNDAGNTIAPFKMS
jgi:hypothetical protein